MMPAPSDGPTVLRILLGTQLRRLRENRGITAAEAAKKIRGSESKISRIELGRNAVREIDILDLLEFYGVGPEEREQLMSLAVQASQPGWWHHYNDILPDWFQSRCRDGGGGAGRIRTTNLSWYRGCSRPRNTRLPSCLSATSRSKRRTVMSVLRKERQRRFRNGQLKLWVIIDEAALAAPGGQQADPAPSARVPAYSVPATDTARFR